MKKKVSSKKDLNSLALSTGGMVTDSAGKKFNSNKKTAHKKPKEIKPDQENKKFNDIKIPEKKPDLVPIVPDKPIEPDKGLLIIAEKMDDMSRTNATLMAGLMEQISKIQLQSSGPITEWNFEVLRDDKGYLSNIHAKAIMNKITLN